MPRIIVAIVDTKARDLVGTMMFTHRHTATAVRMFGEAISTGQNQISMYPNDHELWCFGTIDDDTLEVTADKQLLITGEQWLASQPKTETK